MAACDDKGRGVTLRFGDGPGALEDQVLESQTRGLAGEMLRPASMATPQIIPGRRTAIFKAFMAGRLRPGRGRWRPRAAVSAGPLYPFVKKWLRPSGGHPRGPDDRLIYEKIDDHALACARSSASRGRNSAA